MEFQDLYASLVTIHCGDTRIQTGWCFTCQGHILTAAHGFVGGNNQHAIGVSVKVVRQKDQSVCFANLLEVVKGSRLCEDFAILQITTPTNPNIPPLPITCQWGGQFVEMRYYGAGYSKTIGQTPVAISGMVMSPFLLPKERVIQLTMDASFDAVGLSGCPILSVRNNAVFALQVAQPEATNKMLFAVPLHEIRKRSKLFRELINASIRQTRTWSVFDLDRRTKGRYRDDSPRYIHIIEPADHRHDGARLLEELRSNWPQFCKAIAESLDSALLSLGIQNRIFLSRPELTIAIERIDDKLGNYLDSSRLGANPKLQRTRWVCDLTNTVDFSNGMPLKSMSEASHLIGITFDKTEVVVHGTKIDNLSCFYAIPPTDAAHFVSNIRYVMEDVMLDIALFHATRILKDCYNTTELLRVFSERKVDFAREENLLLYGTCIPTSGDLGYISFAGCCRNKLGGRVNMLLLHDLWHRFVDKFLLMSLSPREKSSTPKMPKALLLARITGARKIGGQINRRKLTNQLNKFNAREGELCAVAVIRKPWRGKKRRKMKGVFGSVKPNSTLICREIKIPTLLGFGNNIDIFFFRWLDSKMMEVQI